ncbi:MAG: CRISPR-associated endonuclease Cas3'' [Methylocella sp.]
MAACAEALLRQEQSRAGLLAKSCNVDVGDLSRCFVALIALHDIGKCARGFQGKVLDLWPDFLGAKPDKELSVRHDAAGVWLFGEDDQLARIAERLLPDLCPGQAPATRFRHHQGVPRRSAGAATMDTSVS